MNRLSTLQEGSTTADAELIVIRTGYDSTNYSSVGEAIRSQVSELHDDINTKNETLTSNINYNKELIDKILIKNLTNDNTDISVNINGATQTVNENNERVVTSTSGYGRVNFTTGNYYNQIRNGEVVSEQYNGSLLYPYNGGQLHKSDAGYKRIGECIAGTIIANYGK